MASITLDDIHKSFGDTEVLKGVSIDILDGEFVTLVGPSGCGKSTLLRILAGLESADSGQIRIGDTEVSGIRPSERDLAMVFQSYALYPHLTVAQNMLTPLKLRDLSAAQRLPVIGPMLARGPMRALTEQVNAVAETLQIQHLMTRKPGQLSGGQRQRVALGRAMVRQPKAFLMDEPLSNLDAALRVHMRAELSQLHRRLGTTFVYVTHDQAEALTMSDHMAVMMEGRVLQYGPPAEVYADPANLQVARFVGSPKINEIPAELDSAGRLSVFGQGVPLRGPDGAQSVSLAIRPEHLRLSPPREALMQGEVLFHENLGSDVFLHLRLPSDTRALVRSTPEIATAITDGTLLGLTASPDKMLLFDATGARIPTRAATEVPA